MVTKSPVAHRHRLNPDCLRESNETVLKKKRCLEGKTKEMFYLTKHPTQFIYGHMGVGTANFGDVNVW